MSTSSSQSAGLNRLKKSSDPSPKKDWKPALAALALLAGFALLLLGVFGDRLRPAVPVQVTRALLLPASDPSTQPANRSKVLFQSSGWIEPDPWTVHVTTLADGIVEEVLFQEGDLVEKDQLLVKLISEDAELVLANAEARFNEAAQLCHAHAEGTEAAKQQVAIAAAQEARIQAVLNEALDRWERVRDLSLREVTEAEKVEAEQRHQQQRAAQLEALALRQQAEAHMRQQEARQEAHARLRDARAVEVDQAKLLLSRMEIRSPMAGRVMKRLVSPGSKRMRAMDDAHSAEVAELYDPQRLRVRVDVPLSEAGGLAVGQPTVITTSLLPGTSFDGVVERIEGIADIQRNTLQAKVTVIDPDPRLRPETLCRVAFYAPPAENGSASASASSSSVWLSEELATTASDSLQVWVVSPEGATVQSRTIQLGATTREGYREVLDGLRVNETVVLSSERPLKPGERVNPDL